MFSSIEEVVVHIFQADGMWLSVMSGDPFDDTMSVIGGGMLRQQGHAGVPTDFIFYLYDIAE